MILRDFGCWKGLLCKTKMVNIFRLFLGMSHASSVRSNDVMVTFLISRAKDHLLKCTKNIARKCVILQGGLNELLMTVNETNIPEMEVELEAVTTVTNKRDMSECNIYTSGAVGKMYF